MRGWRYKLTQNNRMLAHTYTHIPHTYKHTVHTHTVRNEVEENNALHVNNSNEFPLNLSVTP